MSTAFQIIAISFALFMLYIVRVYKKRIGLSFIEMQFWNVMWIGFMFLALFPETLSGAVDTLNFLRVFDLLIVIAFMIITTIVILTFFQVRTLNKKTEKLVREVAIKRVKK